MYKRSGDGTGSFVVERGADSALGHESEESNFKIETKVACMQWQMVKHYSTHE